MMSKHNSPAALSLSLALFLLLLLFGLVIYLVALFLCTTEEMSHVDLNAYSRSLTFSHFAVAKKHQAAKKRNVCSVTIRKRLSEH